MSAATGQGVRGRLARFAGGQHDGERAALRAPRFHPLDRLHGYPAAHANRLQQQRSGLQPCPVSGPAVESGDEVVEATAAAW
ncbi:hypothetical protein J7E93_18460 [Streptomyces sp. ISL-36]|uniref:hypothetical protein n=1 Tax=Streptomyces sp. ISL-36 TaxID=2819182 RepID=UPI001BEAC82C|nr:hypothetical protein [Streptomyces sp. ISL-36]MBT2442053.1 hypothetical protein [Streptomyces sp. ISL-36]